jgi:hypothetical protein
MSAAKSGILIYANTVVQRGTPWVEKPAVF